MQHRSPRSPRQISSLGLTSIIFVLLGCSSLNSASASTGASIKITAPSNGSVVSGIVTIATQELAPISWMNGFVDQHWFAADGSTKPYSVQWNSTTVPNGKHVLTVVGYNDLNQPLALYSIVVGVVNPTSTPTRTRTPTPTPTATPTPTLIKIIAPVSSSVVSGSVTITTQ